MCLFPGVLLRSGKKFMRAHKWLYKEGPREKAKVSLEGEKAFYSKYSALFKAWLILGGGRGWGMKFRKEFF
jgi:hypothetical protein